MIDFVKIQNYLISICFYREINVLYSSLFFLNVIAKELKLQRKKYMRKFFAKLFKSKDPIFIIPFGGYANDKMIHAQARVLEDEGITHDEKHKFLRNLYNSYKRFESDEIENAKVQVTFGNAKTELISDKEGYIYLDTQHNLKIPDNKTNWISINYKLKIDNKPEFEIDDLILKPSPKASFGVISDLDDTVIDTGISSFLKWKVIVNTFFKNSDHRYPLTGVKEFYQQLHVGKNGKGENPFFYLSNSPWNIYDYLQRFLSKHNFPKGVLLLRDIGLENKRRASFLEGNKYIKIKHILETYPKMKFILIGDAADIDSKIYIEIARKFEAQVLSIYIRTVNSKRKMKRVEKLIENTTDVKVILIENTEKAVLHAKENGYID